MIRIYATPSSLVLERASSFRTADSKLTLDQIFAAESPGDLVAAAFADGMEAAAPAALRTPIQSQEVWAAGVTYFRSRTARIAESKDSGGAHFYDLVYDADRPELFFKSTARRVVGPGDAVRIRADSKWNVPEPELTLAINAAGRIFGYTMGNDMSSRDIEGENPLYLPQAKIYDGSTALGPALVVADELPGPNTTITIEIFREKSCIFAGATTIGQIKRPLTSLADWLYRELTFPVGCYLMTGTGIIPPDDFTLARGDEIHITLEAVGTLRNTVI